jgi:hypothetical protein
VDRLNRSLTGLSAQVYPRRSVSCTFFQARSIYFERSLPLLGAQIFFLLLAAAQQGLCAPFFLSGRFSTAVSERQNFLFEGRPVASPQLCQPARQ